MPVSRYEGLVGIKSHGSMVPLAGFLVLMLLGGFLSFTQIPDANATTCPRKHRYDGICDTTNADITCKITSPPNFTIFHTGTKKYVSVEFKIKASDPVDGIKKVLLHVTNDNTSTKVAKLGTDGLYHATWTTLARGTHDATAGCSDNSANTAHDTITVIVVT